jgi:methylated-DNA-[protein]-cysteine S-methyltransferase
MSQSSANRFAAILATPFAALGVRIEDERIVGLAFLPPGSSPTSNGHPLVARLSEQLAEYCRNPAYRFDLPIDPRGSEFRRRVWQALLDIPVGHTSSYGELADSLGSSARAVGQALGDNPLPIIIPCHRVLAAHGLGGFNHSAGGYFLGIKRRLLAHEGALPGTGASRAHGRQEALSKHQGMQ